MSSKKSYNNYGRKRNFGNNKGFKGNQSFAYKDKNKTVVQAQLSESEVGITEYINKSEGFAGIIKARFSDFHVNEIDLAGNIAKLTDTSVPPSFINDDVSNTEDNFEESELLSLDTWNALKNMLTSSTEETFELDVTTLTKKDRTTIHDSVKNAFGSEIVTDTKTIADKKLIIFRKYKQGMKTDMRTKWPANIGEYVYFLVYKEAMDTLEATFTLSSCLKIKSSAFSYAGVKDRRAKTTQWFCVKKAHPKKILSSTKSLYNLQVGNITFKDHPLKLGQLSGNKFRIALRNVTAENDIINSIMESLKVNGFINYYGLQRFGNDKEVPTFEIGIKLLQGSWKAACNLILKLKTSEDPSSNIALAKRLYNETSNSQLVCKQFIRPSDKSVESKLLLGLAKHHNNDYVNALENIPRNMRLLYLHSFQSLVWNTVASRRIKEFGLKPVVGDLVFSSEEEQGLPEEEGEEETDKTAPEVKILTDTDLLNYTIYDIILPLPGYDIKYPENEAKTWYKEILEEYELTLEMPKQKVKTYNLSGAYRNIVGQVKDLSWKTMMYNHPNDTLIRSDYDELKGKEEPMDNLNGSYKALVMEFCLKSSCYATMVLREILKMDTSTSTHAKLNKYHANKCEEEPVPKLGSLLTDESKFEEFKQLVFQTSTSDSKKISPVIAESPPPAKKAKNDEVEDVSIKIQSSLI